MIQIKDQNLHVNDAENQWDPKQKLMKVKAKKRISREKTYIWNVLFRHDPSIHIDQTRFCNRQQRDGYYFQFQSKKAWCFFDWQRTHLSKISYTWLNKFPREENTYKRFNTDLSMNGSLTSFLYTEIELSLITTQRFDHRKRIMPSSFTFSHPHLRTDDIPRKRNKRYMQKLKAKYR